MEKVTFCDVSDVTLNELLNELFPHFDDYILNGRHPHR